MLLNEILNIKYKYARNFLTLVKFEMQAFRKFKKLNYLEGVIAKDRLLLEIL